MRYRTGIGFDVHPFNRELNGLYLGGYFIKECKAMQAESDGDPAIHAVCDSLLSTVCSIDIGELFSDYKERNSRLILKRTLLYLRENDCFVENCALCIITEKDELMISKYRDHISKSLEFLIKAPVTITAGSGNALLDSAKEGVLCFANSLVFFD
jgi:2-C-methyl-D-erythritol 2,4-cyclodiphosphate synthase